MMKHFFSLMLFLITTHYCFTQQTIYFLTIDSAISLANEKNHRIKMLKEDLTQASLRLKSIKRSLKPGIKFDATIPSYSERFELYQDTSSITYYAKKQRLYEGGINIQQTLPTDGKLVLNYGLYNLDDFYNKTKIVNVFSGIGFEQPIDAFYAYNSIRSRYKEAKLRFELANKEYRREELNLIYDISLAFYSVVKAQKEKDIAFQDYLRQKEAYSMANNKYNAGLIREVEFLQMEVDMGEAVNQLDIANTSFIERADYLKQELGILLKDSIIVENKINYKIVAIQSDTAISLALKNRPEIREKQIQIDLTKLDIKRQRSYGLPKASVIANYNFIGINNYLLNTPYATAYNTSYNDMITRPGNKVLEFKVSIPILDWGANRSLVKLEKSKLIQSNLDLDYKMIIIENEIRNRINDLNSSLRRLQLSEKNIKLAEQSSEISYLRFSNGDIDAESLYQDRMRFIRAQKSFLEAYISYKLNLIDISRLTFFDFENNISLTQIEE